MSKLDRLRSRRAARVKKRKRHYRLFEKHRDAGHPVRRAYHLRMFRRQEKAIAKLDRLIHQELERLKSLRIDWNGHPRLGYEPLRKAIRVALHAANVYITATYDGRHTPTSWHYKKRAVDFGSDGPGDEPEAEAQQALLNAFGAGYFAELFGPLPWYVKNGVRYEGAAPDNPNHLHVAVA